MAERGKEFCYKNSGGESFRVIVPHSILKLWNQMPEQQSKIKKDVLVKFIQRRIDWSAAQTEPIEEGYRYIDEFSPVLGEPLSKTAEKLTNPGVKKAVLELLRYKHHRDWHVSPTKNLFVRAVTMAALDGDNQFFKSLGERLKQDPILFKQPYSPDGLQSLLLANWFDTGICFCWFSYRALQDFIERTEGTRYELDTIKKAVVRQLELLRLSPALVRSVERDGKTILLSQEKPARAGVRSIAGLTLADYCPDETESKKRTRSAKAMKEVKNSE